MKVEAATIVFCYYYYHHHYHRSKQWLFLAIYTNNYYNQIFARGGPSPPPPPPSDSFPTPFFPFVTKNNIFLKTLTQPPTATAAAADLFNPSVRK